MSDTKNSTYANTTSVERFSPKDRGLPMLLDGLSLWDLFEDLDGLDHVDWRAMVAYDPYDELHLLLAQTIADACNEFVMIEKELVRFGMPAIDHGPLVMKAGDSAEVVEIRFDGSCGALSNKVLFRMFMNRVEVFTPGRWLACMMDIQIEARRSVMELKGALKEKRLDASPKQFRSIDDSELLPLY